ncbi:MAG: phosphatidylglycerophosphatase A [Candidatus Omnitrophica bacterium]|nr:phosphatidylglycerophosphatase A [Candidatus Omnitrophota bacterium]
MKIIATVLGIGNVPFIPGTLGSLVGLGIAWFFRGDWRLQAAALGVVIILTLWSAGAAARKMGKEDPPEVVIDEVAGMLLGLLGVAFSAKVYAAGFFLFRFFDIVKPPPIRQIQRLPGSWGILADDLLAGLATLACLRLLF